jgi:hypothetical protein
MSWAWTELGHEGLGRKKALRILPEGSVRALEKAAQPVLSKTDVELRV